MFYVFSPTCILNEVPKAEGQNRLEKKKKQCWEDVLRFYVFMALGNPVRVSGISMFVLGDIIGGN